MKMEKPTEAYLLMLAKMRASDRGAELYNQIPIAFSRPKELMSSSVECLTSVWQ
jgi:hypothetical protein